PRPARERAGPALHVEVLGDRIACDFVAEAPAAAALGALDGLGLPAQTATIRVLAPAAAASPRSGWEPPAVDYASFSGASPSAGAQRERAAEPAPLARSVAAVNHLFAQDSAEGNVLDGWAGPAHDLPAVAAGLAGAQAAADGGAQGAPAGGEGSA